jgi:hypothetical protein
MSRTRGRLVHLPNCDTITKTAGRNGSPPTCTCSAARRARELKERQKASASKGQSAVVSEGSTALGNGNYWRRPLKTY